MGRDATPAKQRLQLSKLAKAIENDRKNYVALQWLTILGFSPEVGEDARKIYDPRYDANAPANVLSEMGLQALNRKEIEDSILYFERARKKNPKDPQVLNNLAYAYLQSENKNPEQALLLVDQALTYIRNMGSGASNQQRQQFVSSFMDTRGTALMQLGRMEEAAAALEIAFRNRNDSTEIIQNLIKCYEATGNDRQAEAYRRRLDVQRSKEQAAASAANQ
jgi:Flp pilus assembly protein TadD